MCRSGNITCVERWLNYHPTGDTSTNYRSICIIPWIWCSNSGVSFSFILNANSYSAAISIVINIGAKCMIIYIWDVKYCCNWSNNGINLFGIHLDLIVLLSKRWVDFFINFIELSIRVCKRLLFWCGYFIINYIIICGFLNGICHWLILHV